MHLLAGRNVGINSMLKLDFQVESLSVSIRRA